MEDFTQVIRRMAHEATGREPRRDRPAADPAPEPLTVTVEAASPPKLVDETDD